MHLALEYFISDYTIIVLVRSYMVCMNHSKVTSHSLDVFCQAMSVYRSPLHLITHKNRNRVAVHICATKYKCVEKIISALAISLFESFISYPYSIQHI